MKRLFKEIAITSSAGTITLNATDMTNEYCIIGSDVTINTGLNITMSGMSKGHAVKIYWSQKVTRGSNTITVLDKVLTDTVVDNIVLLAMYNGTTWDVWELPAELDKLIIKDPDGNVTWGTNTTVTGTRATAWGTETEATGDESTAFGNGATASGAKSTAFGETSEASGANATSFGKSSEASGESSTAFGEGCVASGNYSTAFGYNTTASGDYSTTFGNTTSATELSATSFGQQTMADGANSTAFGYACGASGIASTAFGWSNTASGHSSVSINHANLASAESSFAYGYINVAMGDYSSVGGQHNTANDYNESVFGRYATIGTGSTVDWFATDSLFKIGNGASVGARADALKMLKNGNTTVTGIWTFVSGISYTNPNLSATTVEEALDEIVELILGS